MTLALEAKPAIETSTRASALASSAHLAWAQGDLQHARRCLDESLRIAHAIDDLEAFARASFYLWVVELEEGNVAKARAMLERAAELYRRLDRPRATASVLHDLGLFMLEEDDFERATALFTESLKLSEESGDSSLAATNLGELGLVALLEGKHHAALDLLRRGLRAEKEHSLWGLSLAGSVLAIAAALANCGGHECAARLLGAVDRFFEEVEAELKPPWKRLSDMTLATIRQSMDEPSLNRAQLDGSKLTLTQAIEIALDHPVVDEDVGHA
jgi:tetratricopeptide (TPR) repeat protein